MLKKAVTIYLPILMTAAMFLLIFFGDKGILDLRTMQMQKERMVLQNDALVQKNLSLHQNVVRLKDDPVFIENAARKDLGLIKENEIILKLEKKTGKGTDDE